MNEIKALERKVKEQREMITEMQAFLRSILKDKGTGFPPSGDDHTDGDPNQIAAV